MSRRVSRNSSEGEVYGRRSVRVTWVVQRHRVATVPLVGGSFWGGRRREGEMSDWVAEFDEDEGANGKKRFRM